MVTPFPGMDPHLEHPSLWPDVHNTLLASLRNHLVAILRPRYAVLLEERSYLSEPDGVVLVGRPDLAVTPTKTAGTTESTVGQSSSRALTVEVPMPDRIREVWLEIRMPGTGEVVTVVELLSPTNKRPGSEGRRVYEDKRRTVLGTRTHLVEIDLCRSGVPMPLLGSPVTADYRILVSRGDRRPRAELVPFSLQEPIPPFRMPLHPGDAEPLVDLGALLHRHYDDAGYELTIDYEREPVPPVPPEHLAWLDGLLRRAGRR